MKYGFMPGCSLSSYSPENIQKTISHLKKIYPDLAVIQQCCGKPTMYIGQEELFQERFQSLVSTVASCEVDIMITACQGCFSVMKDTPEFAVKSLWEVFREVGLPEETVQKGKNSDVVFAIHDSCPTRNEDNIHESVRWIIEQLGYKVQQSEYTGTNTKCCGNGGMCSAANPKLAQKMIVRRVDELNSNHIVTYCSSCRSAMMNGGAKSWHLLDLIFGNVVFQDDTCPKDVLQSPLQAWKNRFKTKVLLK